MEQVCSEMEQRKWLVVIKYIELYVIMVAISKFWNLVCITLLVLN